MEVSAAESVCFYFCMRGRLDKFSDSTCFVLNAHYKSCDLDSPAMQKDNCMCFSPISISEKFLKNYPVCRK